MRAGVVLAGGLAAAAVAWATLSHRSAVRAGPGGGVREAPSVQRSRAGEFTIRGSVQRGGERVLADVDLFGGGDRPLWGLDPTSAPRLADLLPAEEDVPTRRRASAKTSPRGVYRLADLVPGTYVLRATAADGARGFALVKVTEKDPEIEANLEIAAGALTLRGRVLDGGRAWSGRVAVVRASPGNFAEGASGLAVEPVVAGGFTVKRLDAGPHLVVAFDSDTGVRAAATFVLPLPDEVVLDLGWPFERGFRVVGRDTRAPIAGTEATLWSTEAEAVLATARADADGHVSLPALAGCLWRISAPEYATTLLDSRYATGDEIVLPVAARVEGRLRSYPEGAPVAGALVRARPMRHDDTWEHTPKSVALDSSAVSDAEGRYVLADLLPGDVEVYVFGDDWISKGFDKEESRGYVPYAIRTEAARTHTLDIDVVRTAALEGRVLGAAGGPVAGRAVTLRRESVWRSYRSNPATHAVASRRSVRSDAFGRFRFDGLLPELAVRLDLDEDDAEGDRAPRTGGGDVAGPLVPAPGEILRVDLRLVRPRRVEVSVLDDDVPPRPVPDAEVTVSEIGNSHYGHAEWRSAHGVKTDAAGRAVLFMPPGGPLLAQASIPGHSYRWGVATLDLTEPAGPSGAWTGTLVLPRGLSIDGRVLGAQGAPEVGAMVFARGPVPSAGVKYTDAQGRFRFDGLLHGAWSLHVRSPAGEASTRVAAGTSDVALPLSAPPKEMRPARRPGVLVRVRSPDGAYVMGANVTRVLADGRLEHGSYDGRFSRTEDPAWYFAQMRDGEGPFGPVLDGPVPPSEEELEITLLPNRSIAGVVTDPAGIPVPGAALQLRRVLPEKSLGRHWAEAGRFRADEDGRFTLDRLGAFEHEVAVTGPANLAVIRALPVSASGEMRIVLQPGAAVRGVVRAADGLPAANARVWARLPGETYFDVTAAATTDAMGRFRLDRLPKGPVPIAAAPAGGNAELFALREKTFDLGASEEVEIVLPALGDLAARVERIPGWIPHLFVDGTKVGVGGVTMTADGRLRYSGAPLDLTYTLWVPLGDRSVYRTGLRAGVAEVTLPSETFGEIRGRLVTPPGYVEFRVEASQGGITAYGDVDVDGGFRLGGLLPGPWEITADANRGSWESKLSAKVTAEPGATLDIVLRAR